METSLSLPAQAPTTCLVTCHFGPWPGWMRVWLMGCRANPTIDFLVVSDQPDLPDAPPNVRLAVTSLGAFQDLAAERLGRPVTVRSVYKLCDYKPTYGYLFADQLQAYDYWGHTDLDVMYGDLRRFLTAAELSRYDVLTARREFLVGHFTLYRNAPQLRRLFEQSADFPRLLDVDQVLSFDECGKQWDRLRQGLPPNNEATCDSMTHIVHRHSAAGRLTARFLPLVAEWPELDLAPWRLHWEGGRLWLAEPRCEVMYFHFHRFKNFVGYQRPAVGPADRAVDFTCHEIRTAARD